MRFLTSADLKPMRKRVALLIETSNAYARGLLSGIYSFIREHENWTTYFPELSRGDLPPTSLKHWRGDGVIARVENSQIAAIVSGLGVPVVDVSASRALPDVPWVETHDESIAQLAVQHLLERGFKNFAFCGDDRFAWSRYRRDGMKRILAQQGYVCHTFGEPVSKSLYAEKSAVSSRSSLIQPVEVPGDKVEQAGSEDEELLLLDWLKKLPKPVGILCCYDIRGRQLLEVCERNQIAVPEQVAVLGVDNDELVCNLAETRLSSIVPNSHGAGYLAASLLAKMLSGERVEAKAHLLKPLGIECRLSTDSLGVDDPEMIRVARFIREHACSGIKVEDLLREVDLTRRVFESRFRKSFGHSPHEAIQRIRLRRAEELLRETDLSLSVIADRAGFMHTEYFSVVFKKWKGVSPSQFRESL